MQWSAERNAGFSNAREKDLMQPVIGKGPFSFKRVNVEAARQNPDSLLSLVKTLARLRRTYPGVGQFPCDVLSPGSEQVFAHRYGGGGSDLFMLHNLSGKPTRIELQLVSASAGRLRSLAGGELPQPSSGRLTMKLEPYGFRWAEHTQDR